MKAILLDQTVVAGIGNIYADEALHRSKLHPETRGTTLTKPAIDRLRQSIVEVIEFAIDCRGSTIRDYIGGSGLKGGFQNEFQVYGRTGLPCLRCDTKIVDGPRCRACLALLSEVPTIEIIHRDFSPRIPHNGTSFPSLPEPAFWSDYRMSNLDTPTRRNFLATTAATAALSTLTIPTVHAANNDTLKLALVGCGGRGSGATINALNADPNVQLVAVCDVFQDRAEDALRNLKNEKPKQVNVPQGMIFTGFDGYKDAIEAADVVILATSPGFRPTHLAHAVAKDKHIFMEKPHATDIAGAKSVIESAKLAKQKGLGLVSGFCYRYDTFKRDVVNRIHDGAIGDVQAIHASYLTGPLWTRATKTNDPKQLEYQMRMWYYFTWLSGDFIVEQAIHSVDKAHWVMDALPISATALGGREVRTEEKFGNIFDHFSVVYDFDNGKRVFLECRQQPGRLYKTTQDHIIGTKGMAQLMKHTITTGNDTWQHPGDHDFGAMYQVEHNELFASIRAGNPLNDGERSAMSTLMGIMGREAAYTGDKITWDQLMKSNQTLVPETFTWGENEVQPVATPGKTRLA